MIYILLSILFSSLLVILLKVFERYSVNSSQAIVFNYFSAALCGIVMYPEGFGSADFLQQQWFPYTVLFGLLFISTFTLIGYSVPRAGLTSVSVAQKMSLVIPVSFTIWYFNESLGLIKIIGISMALLAVWFTSRKERKDVRSSGNKTWALPFLIFIGSGIVDAAIKFTQEELSHSADMSTLLTCIFGSAGTIGLIMQIAQKQKPALKNAIGGIILGVVNFASAYFMMKALAIDHIESSVIFPVNNIGIILFTTAVAVFVYNEKLSNINKAGILIAILSILLITAF